MKSIVKTLQEKKILISDGAWGTYLHQKGLRDECPESWNINHPDAILDIAKSYIAAGSDMIETNSFGGSPLKLAHYHLQSRAAELNEAAAAISRQAAGPDHRVLGSIGPTGKILMTGDVSSGEMLDGFRIQARALEKGGADAICIETMTALDEALLAVQAAREGTNLEVICTFTFDKIRDGSYRTMMGHSVEEVVKSLKKSGVDILGTNCGNGFANMIDIVREIRQVDTTIPVLVQANAGSPVVQNGKTVFPETPDQMAARAPDLVKAGANIIGGCCGTTPEHIRAIKEALDQI